MTPHNELKSPVDEIRNIGNFSAHPIKSQMTGQIFDVEDEEAEVVLQRGLCRGVGQR